MLNFTITLSYGLRFLVNLALEDGTPKQLKKVAKEEGISLPYLRKLIIPLEKEGVIKSSKGPGGGFALNRQPNDISLLEVVNALSSNKVMDCLKKSSSCLRYEDCVVKELLTEVYDKVHVSLKDKTLATILKRRKQ